MSYTALYRKFRPQTFADVKGQDHIITTLRNQVNGGRLGHAYLFCGTRGTGKTTIAKILARMVNCEAPTEDGPCCQCASCKAIAEGNSMNVIEIDAASNNGVDNIREIVEEVSYSPVGGKYKVYIIDEVHMLSIGAFNALLKTLEEPPSYVIFVLATTEVHKIPITILSRCQRYDFKRIGIDTISDRLRELVDIEGMQVEDRALKYVAKVADGSMRDALSLLDQCVAFNFGQTLTYDKALDILGAVDTSIFSKMLRLILADDIIGSVELLEDIVMSGRELGQFITDFTWYLRNLMLVKSCDDDAVQDLLDISSEHMKLLKEEAGMLEMDTIFRYIGVFSELSTSIKYSSQKRIAIEMALIKLCRPAMQVGDDAVLDRIRKVEKKLEDGVTVVATSATNVVSGAPKVPTIKPEAVPEDIQRVVREWPTIKGATDHLLRGLLDVCKLSLGEGNRLLMCVTDTVKQKALDDRKEEIKNLISEYIQKEVEIDIRQYDDTRSFNNQYVDLGELLGGITIEEE